MEKNLDIAMLGGTFNPIHNGHLHAARVVLETLSPDCIIFMVSAIPPHKQVEHEAELREHRLNMTYAATKDEPRFVVSDMEIRNGGINYTIDTVTRLKELYEPRRISLILGTDMFLSFEKWKNYDKIFKICELIVLPRFKGSTEEIIQKRDTDFARWRDRIHIIDADVIELSSTRIRALATVGADISKYVPQGVAEYIKANDVYKHRMTEAVAKEYRRMEDTARERVSDRRFKHSLGVSDTAVQLAMLNEADENDARMAGILHDITKELTFEQQMELVAKYGIELDDTEKQEPKLLHAITSPKVAKELFDVSDDIANAIRYHTTGRADMTLLEKILYLADYMEPSRDFEGVEPLRELTYKNIDEALLLALQMSVQEVKNKGGHLHSDTLEAIDFLKAKKQNA